MSIERVSSKTISIRVDGDVISVDASTLRGGDLLIGLSLLVLCLILLTAVSLVIAVLLFSLVYDSLESPLGPLVLILFLSLGGVALLYGLNILVRSVLAYRALIDLGNGLLYQKVAGFPLPSRKIQGRLEILMQPIYSRGGWGWRLAAKDTRSLVPIVDSGILGSANDAQSDANEIVASLRGALPSLAISLDEESWVKNRPKGQTRDGLETRSE